MSTNTTALATRQPTNFEVDLARYEPEIAAALPAHIPPERFRRVIITAINRQPDLLAAERRSLFISCVSAAQDGLLPDGREAALVIFNKKVKRRGEADQWVKHVQYMPMVAGIIKRLRNSGELVTIEAHVVYEHDRFDYELGDDPKIEHKPAMLGDRGKPIGVYAIAKLASGEVQREVMNIAEVERVRAVSRAKDDGPWKEWWEEMARKTVIRRLAKRLPMSSDLDRMLRRDDEAFFGHDEQPAAPEIAPPRPRRSDFADPGEQRFREATESGEFTGDLANEVASEVTEDPPMPGSPDDYGEKG